jgi:hypothetical protein
VADSRHIQKRDRAPAITAAWRQVAHNPGSTEAPLALLTPA